MSTTHADLFTVRPVAGPPPVGEPGSSSPADTTGTATTGTGHPDARVSTEGATMSAAQAPMNPAVPSPEGVGHLGAADTPDASDADPHSSWIRSARLAGHPVDRVIEGQFEPDLLPPWSPQMPPNDLMSAAQEYARARVSWVHFVMPSLASLLRLGESVEGPPPTAPARRRGLPSSVPFPRLVAEQRIAPRALVVTRDGDTVYVLEVPLSWLGYRVAPALGADLSRTA